MVDVPVLLPEGRRRIERCGTMLGAELGEGRGKRARQREPALVVAVRMQTKEVGRVVEGQGRDLWANAEGN